MTTRARVPRTRSLSIAAAACLAFFALGACGDGGSSGGDPQELTFAAAPALGPAPSPLPQQSGVNICENYRFGGRELENLHVPDATRCVLESGVRIDGNVTLGRNSELYADGVFIGGKVQGQGARKVFLSNSTVGGNVQPEQGGEVTLRDSAIGGNIQLERNRGALFVHDNDVDADLQVFQNTGGATILGNTVGGNLQCKENRPDPTGSGNIVQGNKEDQCTGF